MIHGLYLDPRTWQIDITSSKNWNPEKYGLKIDLHPNAFNIPKLGVDKKYKFVVASEVWEVPIRKSLRYLKSKGLKVFLLPREPIKNSVLFEVMFKYDKFLHNGEYYFDPDVLLAPNKVYAENWKGNASIDITGCTKFDYLYNSKFNRSELIKKHGLSKKKKIIFFPSYPPYHHKLDGIVDIYSGREETLRHLEEFAKAHKDYQVVSKIHPMSFKCYRKGIGNGKEVAGTLLNYYKNPTEYMKVIGDVRMSGNIARELLFLSDIVVGFTSTMLLEASILKKKVIHVLIGNTNNVGFKEYKDYFPTAYNKDELFVKIQNSESCDSSQLVNDYIYKVDGNACKRICDSIKKHMGA